MTEPTVHYLSQDEDISTVTEPTVVLHNLKLPKKGRIIINYTLHKTTGTGVSLTLVFCSNCVRLLPDVRHKAFAIP